LNYVVSEASGFDLAHKHTAWIDHILTCLGSSNTNPDCTPQMLLSGIKQSISRYYRGV